MRVLILSFSFVVIAGASLRAQDQTVNGNLFIGQGTHDALGFGPRLNFLGNTDNIWFGQYNSAFNETEFRINYSDDINGDDKFVIGTTVNQSGAWVPHFSVINNGNVGIGVVNPKYRLQVGGNLLVGGGEENLDPVATSLSHLSNSAQMLIGWNRTGGHGESDFISNQGPGLHGGFAFYNYTNSNEEIQLLRIMGNGNVGIGTFSPKEKLSVNGKIRAREIKVENVNWPDYVFKPSYELKSLESTERFIKENGHLPGIPSAVEVSENGIELGEMNAKLLKKIEELTLYLIEKDKELSRERALNEQQEKRLKALESYIQ